MEPLLNQLQFSLTASQIIISFGLLALGFVLGRRKAGIMLSMASVGYWSYTANASTLQQLAASNIMVVIMTGVIGLFMGFMALYTWNAPSSR